MNLLIVIATVVVFILLVVPYIAYKWMQNAFKNLDASIAKSFDEAFREAEVGHE